MCASSYHQIQAFPHTLAMLVVTGSAVTEGGDLGEYFSAVVTRGSGRHARGVSVCAS